MRIDVHFEGHPRISMGLLRRHGMFVSEVNELTLKIGEVIVFARYSREHDNLILTCRSNDCDRQKWIELDYAKLKFGYRRYFLCPLTQKRASEIHLVDGKFGCRQAHARLSAKNGSPAQRIEMRIDRWRAQLLGVKGYARARGQTRTRIIEKLRPIPLILDRFPELEPVFYEERCRALGEARRKARASARADALSMASALSAGRPLKIAEALKEHSRVPAEMWLESTPKPSGNLLEAAPAVLEAHAALDVRALAAVGLGRTKLEAHGLLWLLADGTEIARAVLVVDFREGVQPFLALRSLSTQDGDVPAQIIRLAPSATTGRWFLECPILGKRCDILYLRGHCFASAKANRLVHRSQRSAKSERLRPLKRCRDR